MRKGQKQSEEAKAKIREARKHQKAAIIGHYGITQELYEDAIYRGLRWCSVCKKFLPPEWFYGDKPRQCAECSKASVNAWRSRRTYQRKERDSQYLREWRDANHAHVREKWLAKYGVTPEWYESKFAEQGGKCAICGKEKDIYRKYLCVDHNHRNGQARGLLCIRCNSFISGIEDGLLHPSVAYLDGYGRSQQ